MKIVWAQIKNFRSIKDSGRIYFNPNLTILAGKNESGKSNILKALDCFSNNKFDKESDYPIDYINEYPEVIVRFELDESELQDVLDTFEINKNDNNGVIVTRSAESEEIIHIEVFNKAIEDITVEIGINLDQIDIELNTNYKASINVITIPNIIDVIEETGFYFSSVKDALTSETNNKVEKIIQNMENYIDYLSGIFDYAHNESFKVLIPNFVYFSSFEDIIPNSISSNDEVTPIVNRFFKVVDQDPTILFNESSPQRRRLLTDRISAGVSGDFMGYYSQDNVSLKINLDGEELNFFVYGTDTQKPFQPRQRSQGLQWFLSFYLTLQAEMKTSSILLIDEPGLYLHAAAQEDLLSMLNDLSANSPIIISTHSHWLMDPNRLERIRLVLKDKDHTFVENKIHKGADNYTMKPILSAIGLGLNNDISSFGKKVVLVEGYSDYYYLEAMRYYFIEILGIKLNDFRIYPCIGSAQILNVLTFIIDSDTEYFILLDNDKAGKQIEKKLVIDCGIDNNKILFTPSKNKSISTIEDMFSEKDFCEVILESLEKSKFDKVLVSKRFNERIHMGEIKVLSDESVENFKIILDVVGAKHIYN